MTTVEDSLLAADWCEHEDLERAREAVRNDPSRRNVVALFQLPFRLKLPEKWLRIEHPQKPASYAFFRPTGTATNTIERHGADSGLKIEHGPGFSGISRTRNAELSDDRYGMFVRTQVVLSIELWGFWAEKYPRYLEMIDSNPKEMLFTRKVLDDEAKRPWTVEHFEYKLARRMRAFSWDLANRWLPAYRVSCLAPEARNLDAVDNFFLLDGRERVVPLGAGISEIERHLRPFRPSDYQENSVRLSKRLNTRPVASVYEEYLLNALQQIELGLPELAFVQTVMTVEWFFNEIVADRLVRPITKRLAESPDLVKEHVLSRIRFSGSREPLAERIKTSLRLLDISSIEDRQWKEFLDVIARRNRIVHQLSSHDVSPEEARSAVACGLGIIDATMTALLAMSNRAAEEDSAPAPPNHATPAGPAPPLRGSAGR